MSACAVDGCERPTRSSTAELCAMHYTRVYRTGTTEPKVDYVTCRCCGAVFRRVAQPRMTPAYCSDSCRRAKKLARDQRINPRKGSTAMRCRECGNEYATRRATRMTYCSRRCRMRAEVTRARLPRQCKGCGADVRREIGRGTDRLYCGKACRPKGKRGGYLTVAAPEHPMSRGKRTAFVHRIVLYDHIGPGAHPCHWCAGEVSWSIHYNRPGGLGVDHLDFDRTNNDLSNLVPACRPCNSRRRRTHGRTPNRDLAAWTEDQRRSA